MAGRCALATWTCCRATTREDQSGQPFGYGFVDNASALPTTPQPPHRQKQQCLILRCRPLRGKVLRRRPLLVAVALGVAGVPGFSRHASGGGLAPIAFDVHFEDRGVVDEAVRIVLASRSEDDGDRAPAGPECGGTGRNAGPTAAPLGTAAGRESTPARATSGSPRAATTTAFSADGGEPSC